MCQSGDLNQELEDLLVRVDFRLKVKTSVLTLQISEIQSQARKKCIEPNFILEGGFYSMEEVYVAVMLCLWRAWMRPETGISNKQQQLMK